MNLLRPLRPLAPWLATVAILSAQGSSAVFAGPVRTAVVPSLAAADSPQEAGEQTDEQSPDPVFRSEVRLALHSVAVLDAGGRPVTDLVADDFRIYEDDQPQEISLFLAPNDAPLDVAMVLDSSTSLFYWARIVRRSAKTFLGSLDARDCVYLLPFNDEVGPGTWGRALDPGMSRRVEGIRMHGGTALYDALMEGLATVDRTVEAPSDPPPAPAAGDHGAGAGGGDGDPAVAAAEAESPGLERWSRHRFESDLARAARRVAAAAPPNPALACSRAEAARDDAGRPSRRRAVVLLTDGQDQSSQRRFDEVLATARRQSIPIFPVVMGEARDDPRLRRILETLADSTGGRVIPTTSPEALGQAYDEVVALLRASYLVGYRPPDDGDSGWHQVDVRTTRPAFRLLHRQRYRR